LSGPAASWWENLVAVHPPDKVFTWEEFKKKFRDAHVPDSVVELKKREFEELRQNTAPIMQYVRDFNRLSRYAPEDVDTEEEAVHERHESIHEDATKVGTDCRIPGTD
jgi:hypothetical protein